MSKQRQYKCEYAGECNVYKGEEEYRNITPVIMKNVFCHGGSRGWNNCECFQGFERTKSK